MAPSKVVDISYDTFHNIVDGKPRSADSFHQSINPVTGQKNWDVPIATQQDVDDAVKSANKAFVSWSQEPVERRKELLMKYAELWSQHEEELIDLLVTETGKPRQFAALEVKTVPFFFHHHNALNLPEERVEDDDKVITTRYVPLGVVAAICPWNFPLVLSMGKIVPALMTGNTIIVKPSPFTPYSSLKAVELAQQIFPPGVVQALGGDDRLGPIFTAHPDIHKISFTGSIATGKKIMAACANTLKRVTLELGGNDASIVFPDVDIKKTAPQLVLGAFQNSGQVCVATKRIYIHQDIYEPMLKAMAEFAKTLKIGGPKDGEVQLGPIQNQMQYDRVKGFFEDVKKNNYKLAAGSYEVPEGKGFFITPTIVDNPPNGSRIVEEEPFGPIVPTQPWSDLEEVIARANNTNTGLGACVWSADVAQAEKVARRLMAGSVFVNSYEKPTPQAIFSGHRESGIGGEWGTTGLLAYCNAHAVHVYKQK
ncbi:betaine aldehyde dehydrogenase 1 [Myriangium duriaei CBS 260.36]|uniref:aldehyde dehydrogenase (NAD(+)) n=1 Tax=Myriangium duriaei CBS 260.36 TaxID=1168546 RepID=A0A9P4J8S4_9PEZI|nr:betaine aldehyde dehydrogenase 1 [Myriangium duriaei CBS 260.36]